MADAGGQEKPGPWAPPGAGAGGVPPTPPPDAPSAWPPAYAGGAPYAAWPAPPPARRMRPGLVVLLIVASVAVLSVVAFLAVSVLGDSGSGSGGPVADADPSDAATVEVPDDYVAARAGDVRVSLPPSWVWAELGEGTESVGDRLAPGDPQMAGELDNRLGMLPRSALLVGMDEDDLDLLQFNTNFILMALPDTLPDGSDELRAAVTAELEANEATISSASYLDSGEGPALRVRYSMRQAGVEVHSLQYWYLASDGAYTLSFSSDDLDDYVEVADAMASSFELRLPD